MKNIMLLSFALLAAVGNALFAAGQKKSSGISNSLVVIALSASVCLIITLTFLAASGGLEEMKEGFLKNKGWIILSGCGLFLTYLGFNLLYSRFGTSAYVYYAVLSIITTSIIVGILVFHESFNLYHIISVGLALGSIILFSMGNKMT